MAFFRAYPRQAETTYHHPSSQDVFGDALLAGLSQGMSDLEQLLGPYHRARTCPNSTKGPSGAATRKPTRRVPTTRDPPAAWMWWMLGGGDSSDSEEEGSGASGSSRCEGSCPRGRRHCPAEESCAMKRKPSRSASNAPPSKKKEEQKSEPEEDAPKFNFTGRKTSEKRKSEKKETKKSEKSEAEVVLVKPAPWKHVVQVSDDFGPEDVKVYVRDGRIRVEGRRERNVGGDDYVIEVVEVNRELQPPSEVILDEMSVFFRSGGRLELEAPRRVKGPKNQPELVKKLESMSVDDIEKDAEETTATAPSSEQPTENDGVQNKKASSEEHVEKSADKDDWEMLPEEEVKDNENEEGTTEEQKLENNEDVKEKLEEAAEDEEKQVEEEEATEDKNEESDELTHRLQEREEKLENSQETEESSVKISELEEITTEPIVEEPQEATPTKPHEATTAEIRVKESDDSSSSLTLRIVSEDQQQVQIDENSQLMVMNLAGFEPRDVTVRLDGDRVSVQAVRVTEEEGFLSRKESFRSCRVPDRVRPTELTCTMGPEAKLVITTPSA